METLQAIARNIYPILYLGSVILFVIGIIVAVNIQGTDTAQQKGDKRVVSSIFILVPIILIQFAWSSRNCSIQPIKAALQTF